MKKLLEALFFLLPVVLVIGLIYLWFKADAPKMQALKVSPTTKPTTVKQSSGIGYYGFEVKDLNKLKLLVNFEFVEAKNLLSENNCQLSLNAGFYGKDNKPLGLVVSENEVLSEKVDSELLNAYLWISDLGGFGITQELPNTQIKTAVQSGPLLFVNGEKRQLTINNDKQARRSVVATLANGNLWFLIIFDKTSVFLGPKLANLPTTLEIIAETENKVIIEAINLDGGTASMYKDNQVFLNEFKPIGSLFCVTSE